MIKSSDISVVYAGGYTPIAKSQEEAQQQAQKGNYEFHSVLMTTKKLLPDAEFILATNNITEELEPEVKQELNQVIVTKDSKSLSLPEDVYTRTTNGFGYNWHLTKRDLTLNYNKMLLNNKEGCKLATRKYILRLRTDMIITNPDFLNTFEDYQERRDPEFTILKNRVLGASLFTIDARKWNIYLHHPSDWFNFGLREDVVDMWDLPLQDKIDKTPDPLFRSMLDTRLIPETYIWYSFLIKKGFKQGAGKAKALGMLDKKPSKTSKLPHIVQYSNEEIIRSHKLLFNNFIPIDSSPVNYFSLKKRADWLGHNSIYSFASFLKDYYNN